MVRKILIAITCVAMILAARACNAQDKDSRPVTEEGASLVEAAKEAAKPVVQPAAEMPAEAPAAQPAPEQPAAAAALAGVYDGSALGYMIRYPAEWIYETPASHEVVFSGKKDTDAYYTTVSVQNVLSAKQGGKYNDATEVIDGMVGQLNAAAQEVKVHDQKAFDYKTNDGRELKGIELKADYARQGKKFRQWIIVVPRSPGDAFHIWSYTAPDDLYDTYYGTAQLMLDSWVIS
jgi:hypothetical protein